MFDIVGAGRASRVLGDPGAPGIDRLRAAARLRVLAEAAEAEAIHDLAVEQGWDREGTEFTYEPGGPGERRLVRVGADGTPWVDEALPLEVATARGTSVGAAISLVKDVVDLSQRLPLTWKAVCAGRAPLWHAQRVSQACGDLPKDKAGVVDVVVAPLIGHLGYARLMTRVRAAVVKAAPRLARKKADEAARSRYCVKRESSGDTGTCFIEACVDTADAVFLDATVDRLAEILGDRGTSGTRITGGRVPWDSWPPRRSRCRCWGRTLVGDWRTVWSSRSSRLRWRRPRYPRVRCMCIAHRSPWPGVG